MDVAFGDLMIVAVQLLPGMAPFAKMDSVQEACAKARASAELPRWPAPCVELLEACELVASGKMDALRNGEIGRAGEPDWPEPGSFWAWHDRADVGDGVEREA